MDSETGPADLMGRERVEMIDWDTTGENHRQRRGMDGWWMEGKEERSTWH